MKKADAQHPKSKSLAASFGHALQGFRHTLLHERNFKIHVACALLATAACIFWQVDAVHSFMVMYAIFCVMALELVNTAVEALVDLHCGQTPHPLAKIAKDCCAAAVLLAAIQALLVAVIVAQHLIFDLFGN